MFNHESPLRGQEFVTRKITHAVARIHLGMQEWIELGNLDAKRDWGFAKEYTHGMQLIIDHSTPDNFVLATGKSASVRDFVRLAFEAIGVNIRWRGCGVDEEGLCEKTSKVYVKINRDLFRPSEVDFLLGDAEHAYKTFGWKARTELSELCRMMVEADIRRNRIGFSF